MSNNVSDEKEVCRKMIIRYSILTNDFDTRITEEVEKRIQEEDNLKTLRYYATYPWEYYARTKKEMIQNDNKNNKM